MHEAEEVSQVALSEDRFAEFVATRAAALLRTAYLLTGDQASAEDLVQEALLQVYRSRQRLRAAGALESYVRTTMLRTHISWRRHADDPVVTQDWPSELLGTMDDRRRSGWLLAAAAVVVLIGGVTVAKLLSGGSQNVEPAPPEPERPLVSPGTVAMNGPLVDGLEGVNLLTIGGRDATGRTLAVDGWTIRARDAAWAPDGSRLAYSRELGDAIWVADADGTDQVELATPAAPYDWVASPDWSPDGESIAFVTGRGEDDPDVRNQIRIVDVATGETVDAIDLDPNMSPRDPRYSPDGDRLAVTLELWTRSGPAYSEVVVVDLASHEVQFLTSHMDFSLPRWSASPTWSPDGTEIMFNAGDARDPLTHGAGTRRGNATNLWVTDLDKDWYQLTHLDRDEEWVARPEWGPGCILATIIDDDQQTWHLGRISPTGEVVPFTDKDGEPVWGVNPRLEPGTTC